VTEAEDELAFDRMEREADYAFRLHLPVAWMPLPARVRFDPPLTESELLRFSETNDIVWIEREADGAIYMRPIAPTIVAMYSGHILADVSIWAETDGRGTCCGRAGWCLPDGSMRGASISWILTEKLNRFTKEERKGFVATAPDFVIEFMSSHHDRAYLEQKMGQWIANGVQLAWLIDSDSRTVTIYRSGEEPEVLVDPRSIRGTGPVRGFELMMARVWGS